MMFADVSEIRYWVILRVFGVSPSEKLLGLLGFWGSGDGRYPFLLINTEWGCGHKGHKIKR
jgi:hypothetical protein